MQAEGCCSSNELEYVIKWLESLCNKKAIEFRDSLLEFMNKLKNLGKYYQETVKSFEILNSLENTSIQDYKKKTWIKRKELGFKNWIKSQAYITRVSKMTGRYNTKKLTKINFNYLFCKLIKVQPNVENVDFGINVLNYLRCRDVYGTYKKIFDNKYSSWTKKDIRCPEVIYDSTIALFDVFEERVETKILGYEEMYIKENVFYIKSTIVFLDQKDYKIKTGSDLL